MYQGQDAEKIQTRGIRLGTGRRIGTAVTVVIAMAMTGIGMCATSGSAGAATRTNAATSTGPTTTTTKAVSPNTTVTTTTTPRSVNTSTTTVTTTPVSVTTTTVTKVTTSTVASTTSTTAPKTTTTTTVVPVTTNTTPPTTTTAPTAAPSTPTTTVPSTPSSAAPTTSTTTVPGPASFDTTCSQPATPNLQTYLDSLPDGSVFRSSTTACYLVPLGIVLTHPITIVGGTFYDTTDTRTAGTLYNSLKPIILIKGTSRVSLSGVTAMGTNIGGDFAHRLVGQAGIKIMSSNNVTLTDVTAKNTYGDGLELVANFGNPVHTPVTGLSVEGFTTINAGRQGVTLAEVSSSVLNHVNVINPADAGFDFESDLAGVGSDNVTISNCTDTAGFRLNEFFSGPINITGCTGFHHVSLISPTSNAPITFTGGTLLCKRAIIQPCIDQNGGSLTFVGVTIDRMPGVDKITELTWSVYNSGALSFIRSPITTPTGTIVRPATIKFAN